MIPPDVVPILSKIVGEAYVSPAEADRRQYSRDQSSYAAALPDVIVWPATTAEVSAVAHFADSRRIPLVGWGAGTGLEGNALAIHGGIVVAFARMNRILAVHDQDFQVTVQPGVLYMDMNAQLARHGLFFAPDPGANASIGGMVANNAAGIRTVKYGATRDNVLALEVVLADGTVIHTGSRSVKQSAGYDLTHLFTGSEGTLGLITAATLKLAPLPAHFSAVIAAFPTAREAADAVFGIIGAGLNPGALEFLDAQSVLALRDDAGFNLELLPNLFMEFSGASEPGLGQDLALAEEICRECGCVGFEPGMGIEARNRLWEARHRLFEVLVRRFPGRSWLVTDIAVPISGYPTLVTHASELIEELALDGSLVGHAGDGNLHTAIFYDAEDVAARQRVSLFNDRLVDRALALDGTCTGEHGVGLGKQKYMELEHGPEAMDVMRRIKAALDPRGILNPGKVLAQADLSFPNS